jgi:hypothetical protein
MDGLRFIRIKGTPCHHSGKRSDGAPKSFELNADLIAALDGNKVLLKSGNEVIKLGEMHYNNLTVNNDSNTTVI